MPTYTITDPQNGRKVRITGDSPPTEAEINQIFAAQVQAPKPVQAKPVAPKNPVNPLAQFAGERLKGKTEFYQALGHNFTKPFIGAARYAINKDAESGGEMALNMAGRFNQWADDRNSQYEADVPDNFYSGAGAVLGGGASTMLLPQARVAQSAPLLAKAGASAVNAMGFTGLSTQADNGETTVGDMGVSGVVGAAIPGAGALGVKIAKGGSDNIPRMTKGILAAAQKYGIPVYPHQISDSRLVKTLSSSLGEMPFSGAQAYIKKQADAYTKFVSSLIGKDAKNITQGTIESAKKVNSDLYNKTLDDLNIPVGANVFQKIIAARNSPGVGAEARQGFDEFSDSILDEINRNNGALQGRVYQDIRRALIASKNPAARDVRKILEKNTEQNIPPERLIMFKKANEVNTNIKAVEKAMKGADTANAKVATEGTVNPATFRNAVDMKYKPSKQLQYAAKIGQKIKDPIANSGTFARSAIGATAPILGATGAIGGVPALGSLATILGLSAVGGATAGRVINSPMLARYMVGGMGKNAQKAAQGFEKTAPRYAGPLAALTRKNEKDKK